MKYGFVYIWMDRKHKRFYIGSHWGDENDGYVCSSRWMRQSYKRRPNDFKRRVVCRVYTNRNDLLEVEHHYLLLIEDDLLGKKYYNLTKHLNGHWSTDEEKRLTVGQKISKSSSGVSRNCGAKRSESEKLHLKECAKKQYESQDNRELVSENLRNLWKDPSYRKNQELKRKQPRPWMVGRKLSDETRAKMAEAARNRKKRCDK